MDIWETVIGEMATGETNLGQMLLGESVNFDKWFWRNGNLGEPGLDKNY